MSDKLCTEYFEQRMAALGITPEINKIEIMQSDPKGPGNILVPLPIFSACETGIRILAYSIDRTTIRIDVEGSRYKKDWSIIRLEKPIVKKDGTVMKYQMPKGHGSVPFLPPGLVEKYEKKTPIKALFITEGYFKAFKGYMHGLDIIGVASITHLKDRESGGLHRDILAIIRQCKVERVVWLTDGDCLDITSKEIREDVDLFKRPNGFYQSVNTFKQLLDDYDPDKYFMHLDIDNIIANLGKDVKREDVKGLDDLLITGASRIKEIIADLQSVSTKSDFFVKFNITRSTSKVWSHFRLDHATSFYLYHLERRKDLEGKIFTFRGTKFKYDDEKGECQVLVPGTAKDYFRVGDTYFKFVEVPNKYKQLERKFKVRQKSTISDDHGRDFIKHVTKYEEFCNVPDHVNFHQVINSCFNLYNPLDFEPDEEECTEADCPNIIEFVKHIFGENVVHFTDPETKTKHDYKNWELGLDYIQILYQQPAEKLPIICLVSKENNTGKSTFGKLLKQIFGSNCAIVGNSDLSNDFNGHWSTKSIVICDETKIDKQHVVEKVKSLSTADKIFMNTKGKDQIEIDCFIKFLFITNNEDNFMFLSEEDIRYWVLKVPVIKTEKPKLLEDFMIPEIPAFLSFLTSRKLVTERSRGRMWFHKNMIVTEALKKVVEFSKPQVVKEIEAKIKELFLHTGEDIIYMTKQAINEDLLSKKVEEFYLERLLKDHLRLSLYHKWEVERAKQTFDDHEAARDFVRREFNLESELEIEKEIIAKFLTKRHSYPKFEKRFDQKTGSTIRDVVYVSDNGRPYIFRKSQFLNQEEIDNYRPDPEHAALASGPATQSEPPPPSGPSELQSDLPF
ncbi:MAG: primase-helicase family protein [Pseudobacter sp.]|uniref:primase-helicase family protein n=1 Tax=Pseudobacter sp. TaxID=2045420 RepID=UPI003F7FA168